MADVFRHMADVHGTDLHSLESGVIVRRLINTLAFLD
jgi:cold shock CspA family protein